MSNNPVPYNKLNARVSPLEWAMDAANGDLKDWDWMDGDVDPRKEGFVFHQTEEGKKYRHRTLGYFLPTIMARTAHQAQKNGDPTVLESLNYIYAHNEWMTAARKYFWSPMSPVSKLLSLLSEVYGVSQEIHRNDPQALARLIARLPAWHKQSGTALKAQELLVDIVGRELPIRVTQSASDKELEQEALVSHEWQWWKLRKKKTSIPKMKISNGFLCFQSSKKEEQYELVKEDVLISWKEGVGFPKDFLRLLPIWASVRIIINKDNSSESTS